MFGTAGSIRRITALGLALGLLLTGAPAPVRAAPIAARHVQVELVADVTSVEPGRDFRLGVHFVPEREWHVYWRNPGDSGEAPRIEWSLPSGLAAGALEWPAPSRLETGSIVSYGYPGDVLLAAPVASARELTAGTAVAVRAQAKWLVCNRDECIPGSAPLTLSLPVGPAAADPPPAARLFADARRRVPLPVPDAWHVSVTADTEHVDLGIRGLLLPAAAPPTFFPYDRNALEPAAPQTATREADGFRLTLARRSGAVAPPTLAGVLDLGERAYVIESPIVAGAPSASATAVDAAALAFTPIGLAFLGGLLLNLMPCVFPVLALKALALVGLGGEARRRVRRHGLVYAFGIVVSFWVLAGLLLAARAGGTEIGWGFQLQSPSVIAALAGLFFWMALVLLDVATIGGSLMGVGQHLTTGDGDRAAFFTGVLATVVATPCTAPFMGTAIGYALGQPAAAALAVFTSLGLGLAFPYVLITFVPALASRLPRPGAWMETLKQFLAFPLLATVVWLVWVASFQAGPQAVSAILMALVLLAFAAWTSRRWSGGGARAIAAVSVAVAAVLALTITPVDRHADTPTAAIAHPSSTSFEWEPFSTRRIAELRAQGKPVFVDFTAAWCVTCQVNKKVALETAEVVAKMQQLGVIAMRADWTRPDAEITRALQEFGRDGVPLYVLYSGGRENPPRILPQILTPTIVISELEQIETTPRRST